MKISKIRLIRLKKNVLKIILYFASTAYILIFIYSLLNHRLLKRIGDTYRRDHKFKGKEVNTHFLSRGIILLIDLP